jgi:hypothetical protein
VQITGVRIHAASLIALVGKNAPKEDTELVSLLASLVVCD